MQSWETMRACSILISTSMVLLVASSSFAQIPEEETEASYEEADSSSEQSTSSSEEDEASLELDEEDVERGGVQGLLLFALRGSFTRTTLNDQNVDRFGTLLGFRALAFGASDALTFRSYAVGDIGGGNGGFEGTLKGELALGLLGYLSGHHALFIRAGGRGEVVGNNVFYQSILMLPDAQLGYQHIAGDRWGFELAGRAGAGVDGRHNIGDNKRNLDSSIAYGAFASYTRSQASLGVSWLRSSGQSEEPNSPVDFLEAFLCGSAELDSPDIPISLCVDGRYGRGLLMTPGGATTLGEAWQAGVLVGIGGNPVR